MEAAGLTLSAVALATLFNSCVDCFEAFSQGANLQKDLSYLLIRLDFEKTQLLLWGNSSGILKTEKEERHIRLRNPETCKLVEDALDAIHGLLTDASILRQKYGVESVPATLGKKQLIWTNLLSSNSMEAFRLSWCRFCVRAAAVLPKRNAPSMVARARWAILDRSKFTELLETLTKLVENLQKVIPVSKFQYDELETDLEAILDISQLRLVETALQSSSSPKGRALSKAASTIVSNSENGTVDRRNVVEWLRDTQWIDSTDGAGETSTTTQGGERLSLGAKLNFLAMNSKQSLYFVNTPECRNLTTSTACPTIATVNLLSPVESNKFHMNGIETLRLLFPNLARSKNFQPTNYAELFEHLHESSYEVQELTTHRINQMLPFGIIYIHTSPCQAALQTATDFAYALAKDQLNAVVRVDDRISTSCFSSTADRIVVLQSILQHLDAQEPYPIPPWKYLDRTWLDQRLYLLESDVTDKDDNLRTSASLDIFDSENFPGPFAGLIIVGEVDFCAPLLQAEPFPWTPRFPREGEVYEITRKFGAFQRKYISKFAVRHPLTKIAAATSQRQASVTSNQDVGNSELQANKRSASPLASSRGKRALVPSMILDGGILASDSSSS